MLLAQVAFLLIGSIPAGVLSMYMAITQASHKGSEQKAIESFVDTICFIFIYTNCGNRYYRYFKMSYSIFFCSLVFMYFMEHQLHFENKSRKPYKLVAGHEDIRRIKLCRLFQNYKQLFERSADGEFGINTKKVLL
jgi:hypothetical protein